MMMKQFIQPIALIALYSAFASCTISTGEGGETFVAEGEVITKEHVLSENFDDLTIEGVFITNLHQGDENKVTFTAQENVHEIFSAEVKNGRLVVGFNDEQDRTIKNVKKKLNLDIEVKDIHSIHFEGVGKLDATNIKTDSLTVTADSVGAIELNGQVNYVKLQNNGVGSIKARHLKAKKVVVSNNGVGSVSVYASEEIDANNNGVGSIAYYGSPEKKSLHKNGIGSIKEKFSGEESDEEL